MAAPVQNSAAIIPRALGRFTSVFKNQPNVQAITKAMLVGFPELHDLFFQIMHGRILDEIGAKLASSQPVGDQLDQIGPLVGQPLRNGRSDIQYFTAIKLQIRVNRSQGTSEDVIQVANLMYPGATYDEYPDMKWIVGGLWDLIDPITFKRMLFATKAGGSGGRVIYSGSWAPSTNLAPVSVYGSLPASYTTLSSVYGSSPNPGVPVAVLVVDPS